MDKISKLRYVYITQLLFCGLNGNVVNVYNPDALLWAKYEG